MLDIKYSKIKKRKDANKFFLHFYQNLICEHAKKTKQNPLKLKIKGHIWYLGATMNPGLTLISPHWTIQSNEI